jgi:hypothetical protein
MPTQLKTSFSFPLLHFPSPDPTTPRSDPLDTSARGDGSLTLFQIQKLHGDAVPPTPWYHSGLITAHRGVVRTRLRKNSQNQNLITGVWATSDLRTERPEEGMANSLTKAEKPDGSHSSRLDRRAILCGIVVICDILYQDSNTKVNEWMNDVPRYNGKQNRRITKLRAALLELYKIWRHMINKCDFVTPHTSPPFYDPRSKY